MKAKPARAREFQSKLAAYSATATATLLVTPAVADAQDRIYNITSITPVSSISWLPSSPGGGPQSFTAGPFQGDMFEGVNTLYYGLHAHRYSVAGLEAKWASVLEIAGSGSKFAGSGSKLVQRFGFGNDIDAAVSFDGSVLAKRSMQHGKQYGLFLPPANGAVTGYIGFRFTRNNHQTYYGWLRVQVDGDANGYPDEISLIAKAGDPGIYGAYGLAFSNITAGESAPEPTPEPSIAALGGLGLLALGAAGVRELRRRRKNPITARN